MRQKLTTLIYLFESYYFQSWQYLYQSHQGVWETFQKQEERIMIENICHEAQLILNNLGQMNQGEYTAIIRKFSPLKSRETIQTYLEEMLVFFEATKDSDVSNYRKK